MRTITYEEAKAAKEILIKYLERMQNNHEKARDNTDGTTFPFFHENPKEWAALLALEEIL